MNISYSEPLSRAWLRMKTLLFRPFDIGAWFVLGFSAFLAGLGDSFSSNGGNFTNRFQGDTGFDNIGEMTRDLGDYSQGLMANSFAVGLAILAGIIILVIALVMLWLSSRGKFMFLDNLIHQRTEVTKPWREFAAQGDSLFVWQVGYWIISMVFLGMCALLGVAVFVPLLATEAGWIITVPLVIIAGTIAFILLVALLYIDFFLSAFVVPIMHRDRIGTMAAWSQFLAIFREHPGSFFLSGIFYMLLTLLSLMAYLVVGLLTCCVGLLLMAIPYVGSVITLPAAVTLRYFTLDFLGQFGDDFKILDPVSPDQGPYDTPEDLTDLNNHRAVIGAEDIGENGSSHQPGPESS